MLARTVQCVVRRIEQSKCSARLLLTSQDASDTLPSPLTPQGLVGSVISTIITVTLSKLLNGSTAWSTRELAIERSRSVICSGWTNKQILMKI